MSQESNVQNNIQTITSFEDMELREKILRGIYSYGFEYPSSIQQKGIVPIIQKNDVIEQAQSGMGKTATFNSKCTAGLPGIFTVKTPLYADLEMSSSFHEAGTSLPRFGSLTVGFVWGGIYTVSQYCSVSLASMPAEVFFSSARGR